MSLMVQLPELVEKRLRAKALAEGTPVEVFAAAVLASMVARASAGESWLDVAYHAECERDSTTEVTLDEVRYRLSKIPGRLVDDFHAERDE